MIAGRFLYRGHAGRKPQYDGMYVGYQSGSRKNSSPNDNYEYLLPKHKCSSTTWVSLTNLSGNAGRQRDRIVHANELGAPMVGILRRSIGPDRYQNARNSRNSERSPSELGGRNIPYHVVAIKRGNETIIPRGDDIIKLHDIVYFTTTRKYIPYIRKIAGKENYADVRNVMIMAAAASQSAQHNMYGLHAGQDCGK